jgi:hypothetical protein
MTRGRRRGGGLRRGGRTTTAPTTTTTAIATLLAALLPASLAAAKPGPAAAFGVSNSQTCLARTIVSPAAQRNGFLGYATAVQPQTAVVSAPGERNPSNNQRRAYLAIRAAPRPPTQCVFTSYFQLAPVPSPANDFVQLSVFGATGAASAGQRTFAVGSLVDSAYYSDFIQSSSGAQVASVSSSSAATKPDALMAQALSMAAATEPKRAAAVAAGAASIASSSSSASELPRSTLGRASAALSTGQPLALVSLLASAAAARASSSSSSPQLTTAAAAGDRLRAFMAPENREQRVAATAPLLRAAQSAASSPALLAAWTQQQSQQQSSPLLIAPLVANASVSGLLRTTTATTTTSSSLLPRLTLIPGATPTAVPEPPRDRPRLASGSSGGTPPSPLAAAAAAVPSSSSSSSLSTAASAIITPTALTPTVYNEVALTYRLIAQGSPAQGAISNIRRTQVQGPFSLPVAYDLVADADVDAFFQQYYGVAGAVFVGNSNPWVSVSSDGSAALFNDLRMYGAPNYGSLLYDGSLQVFLRQGTTNTYKTVDLIYNPYFGEVAMIWPIFSAMSDDGLTIAASGYAYDTGPGPKGTDAVLVFTRASTSARFALKQTLTFDSLTEAVTSVGLSPDGLALAVATTTFEPLDGQGSQITPDEILASVAVARTYGRTSQSAEFSPRCYFGNLLPDPSQWDQELAPTSNAGRVQAVKLAPILGKKPRRGPTPIAGYRLLATVLGAPAEIYDYSAALGARCPSVPVQRIGAPLGVPGAMDSFGATAGSAMSSDGRTATVGSELASEASLPQQSGAAYYYGLLPLSTRL